MKAKFKLESTPTFERELKALDQQVRIRILQGVQVLAENSRAGKPLKGRWAGTYSLRIGDYRVIYLVTREKIILVAVGHRKSVY